MYNEIRVVIHHMPDGTPAPSILTVDELIRFLRLDLINVKDPRKTVDYYRQRGLPAVRLGLAVRFVLEDVVEWVSKLRERSTSTIVGQQLRCPARPALSIRAVTSERVAPAASVTRHLMATVKTRPLCAH